MPPPFSIAFVAGSSPLARVSRPFFPHSLPPYLHDPPHHPRSFLVDQRTNSLWRQVSRGEAGSPAREDGIHLKRKREEGRIETTAGGIVRTMTAGMRVDSRQDQGKGMTRGSNQGGHGWREVSTARGKRERKDGRGVRKNGGKKEGSWRYLELVRPNAYLLLDLRNVVRHDI